MEKKGSIRNPIVDDILDRMFAELEGRNEFDEETIKSLKELRTRSNLKKAARVRQAVEPKSEAQQ